jgi:hypothetical protein
VIPARHPQKGGFAAGRITHNHGHRALNPRSAETRPDRRPARPAWSFRTWPEERLAPALTKQLGIGRSATYDRIRRALQRVYLVNEAKKDERRRRVRFGVIGPDEL